MVPGEALDTLFAVVRTDQGNVMKIAVVIAGLTLAASTPVNANEH